MEARALLYLGSSVTVRNNTVVNFFVDHMHTQFTEESKMATALTPQTDVPSGEAYRKRLKTQLNNCYYFLFH